MWNLLYVDGSTSVSFMKMLTIYLQSFNTIKGTMREIIELKDKFLYMRYILYKLRNVKWQCEQR